MFPLLGGARGGFFVGVATYRNPFRPSGTFPKEGYYVSKLFESTVSLARNLFIHG